MWAKEFRDIAGKKNFMERKGQTLGKKFEIFKQVGTQSVRTRHFVWLRLKNVPLGAWDSSSSQTLLPVGDLYKAG